MRKLGIGVPELFILLVVVVVPVLFFTVLVGRRRRRFGYPSAGAYLRAVPGSDAEKRDAADLALKGIVSCVLGLLFPPILIKHGVIWKQLR